MNSIVNTEVVSARSSAAVAWCTLALLTLCNVFALLDRLIVSLLVEPLKNDLGLSDVQIGLLQGPAFVVLYVLCAIPIGRLVDLGNRRRLAAAAVSIWSLFSAACGLARSFAQLFGARMGVGLGEAALTPLAYSILSDSFDKTRLGRVIAIYSTGGVIGSSLGLVIGGSILEFFSQHGSPDFPGLRVLAPWQLTFLAVGLPGLVLALIVWYTMVEPPRPASAPKLPFGAVLRDVLAARRFYFCTFAGYAALGAMMYGFTSWAPTYLVRTFHLSAADAGRLFGLIMLFTGIAGPLISGAIADQLYRRFGSTAPLRLMAALFAALALSASALPWVDTLPLALTCCSVIMLLTSAVLILPPLAIQTAAAPRARGQLASITLVIGQLIGLGTGPVGVAALNQYLFAEAGLGFAIGGFVLLWSLIGAIVSMAARAVPAS